MLETEGSFTICILVGAARSGTTFLAKLLDHPDITYIEEPNFIWKRGLRDKECDEATELDATSKVQANVRGWFRREWQRRGMKKVVLEKTPSNTLRLRYVLAIMPNAKFIFLRRDVDKIATSALRKWKYEDDRNTSRLYHGRLPHRYRHIISVGARLRFITFSEILSYVPRFCRELRFLVLGRERDIWGPIYKGMKEDTRKMEPIDVCRKQAQICTEEAELFFSQIPEHQKRGYSYDDLLHRPDWVKSDAFAFIFSNN